LTWNVFRGLGQVSPALWLAPVLAKAFGTLAPEITADTAVRLWERVGPPLSSRGRLEDEHESEIDIVFETDRAVVFVEAKYRSDVSLRTTNNQDRDQIIRNVDVGSYWAGLRDFHFLLLILNESYSPNGVRLLTRYQQDRSKVLAALPHRHDGLANLRALGLVTWGDFAQQAVTLAQRAELTAIQLASVTSLSSWLAGKQVG
jgi:hypothetical protein